MVRGMMPGEAGAGANLAAQARAESGEFSHGRGQVVVDSRGKTTTYVGATHFMAMLDDVSSVLAVRSCDPSLRADEIL